MRVGAKNLAAGGAKPDVAALLAGRGVNRLLTTHEDPRGLGGCHYGAEKGLSPKEGGLSLFSRSSWGFRAP